MNLVTLLFIPAFLVLSTGVSAQSNEAIFLTGKVVLADGNPAPKGLLVELVCEGKVIRQTHPAQNGSFSFDLGKKDQTTFDSRQTGDQVEGRDLSWERGSSLDAGFRTTPGGRIDLTACVVRLAPTAGFTSEEINLSQRRALDSPDIGALIVQKTDETGRPSAAVLVSTLQAPKKAKKALEKARAELSKNKINYGKVVKELEKAVKEYPQFTEAWTLLGEAYTSIGELEKSCDAFTKAVSNGEEYIPAYLNLARVHLQSRQWKEAEEMSSKALKIDPDAPHGLFYNGIANYYLKNITESEQLLNKLRETGHIKEFPLALLHLGMIHANRGRIPEAAGELREYLDLSPEGTIPAKQRKQIEAQLQNWRTRGLIK